MDISDSYSAPTVITSSNNSSSPLSDSLEGSDIESGKLRTIHEYVIIETLGTGAQGTVEKARRKRDGQLVAIKVITSKNIEKAKMEAEILEEISKPQCNPFLACYLDHFYDFENGKFIIEMEYVQGKNLKRFINETTPDKVYRYLLLILRDLVTGLTLVHSKGIIHGDIKPDNIIITNELVPKLVDFGLGCKPTFFDNNREYCKELVGTPQYIAPETVTRGLRYYSSDIWSLGVTMYYCATNTYPFPFPRGAQIPEILGIIARDKPNFLNTSNKLLNEIVNRSLIKDPFNRIGLEEISEKLKFII